MARATPVFGDAHIAGNVILTASGIQFDPHFTVPVGTFETGDFAGLTGGTMQSLAGGPQTGDTDVASFLTFTEGVAQPVVFDLTYIAPGVGTGAGCSSSALGALCTPENSPFTLVQLGSQTVIIALQLNGMTYTGSAASGSSATTSIFSTQTVLEGTIPQLVSELASGQAITGVTYSASFHVTESPEPASLLLVALGVIGFLAGSKVRRG